MIKFKEINYNDIVTPERMEGAILNQEYTGFEQDYSVLHCLLKMYPVKRFLEIGTNMGTGTGIICNALGHDEVYSLDLPVTMQDVSLQTLVNEGKATSSTYETKVGSYCNFSYHQIFESSLDFNYDNVFTKKMTKTKGAFVDGEHVYENAYHESKELFQREVDIVVWHDADMIGVWNAIQDATSWIGGYSLYRVPETRIAFALRDSKYSI